MSYLFLSSSPTSILIKKEAFFKASKSFNNKLCAGLVYRNGIDSTNEYLSVGVSSKYFLKDEYTGFNLSTDILGNLITDKFLNKVNEFETFFNIGYRIYISDFYLEPLFGYSASYKFSESSWGANPYFNLLTGIKVF